jgi:hypothetical protein
MLSQVLGNRKTKLTPFLEAFIPITTELFFGQ